MGAGAGERPVSSSSSTGRKVFISLTNPSGACSKTATSQNREGNQSGSNWVKATNMAAKRDQALLSDFEMKP